MKVNFTKIFDVDGAQELPPYFKFYPYAEWNDVIAADTSWYPYPGYPAQKEMLGKMGYDPEHNYSLWIRETTGAFNNGIPYSYTSPFISVPKASTGSLTVSSCREKAGITEYMSYIDAIASRYRTHPISIS